MISKFRSRRMFKSPNGFRIASFIVLRVAKQEFNLFLLDSISFTLPVLFISYVLFVDPSSDILNQVICQDQKNKQII